MPIGLAVETLSTPLGGASWSRPWRWPLLGGLGSMLSVPSSNRLEIPACDDAPSNKFNLHARTKGRASGFLVRSDVLPDPAASQSRSASLPQHMHTLDTCHTGPSILAAAAPKAANTRRNNSNSTDTRSGTAWHAVLLSEHDRIYSSRSQSRLWNLMEAG